MSACQKSLWITKTAGILLLLTQTINTQTNAAEPWSERASMTYTRGYGMSLVPTNGKLYALGSGVNIVEEYDPNSNAWRTKGTVPSIMEFCTATAANGRIYAVSGLDNKTFMEYNPTSNVWTTKAPLPTARYGFAMAAVNGKVYVISGQITANEQDQLLSKVEMYDPTTNRWTTRTSIPTMRRDAAAAVVSGKIYVLGGYNNGRLNLVEVYDTYSNTWTRRASMPTNREGLGAATINGRIYAAGGYGFNQAEFYNHSLSVVEVYDPSANRWSSQPSMLVTRYRPGVATVNGRLYAAGGIDNSTEEWIELNSMEFMLP